MTLNGSNTSDPLRGNQALPEREREGTRGVLEPGWQMELGDMPEFYSSR